jgi:hypothetical protein
LNTWLSLVVLEAGQPAVVVEPVDLELVQAFLLLLEPTTRLQLVAVGVVAHLVEQAQMAMILFFQL